MLSRVFAPPSNGRSESTNPCPNKFREPFLSPEAKEGRPESVRQCPGGGTSSGELPRTSLRFVTCLDVDQVRQSCERIIGASELEPITIQKTRTRELLFDRHKDAKPRGDSFACARVTDRRFRSWLLSVQPETTTSSCDALAGQQRAKNEVAILICRQRLVPAANCVELTPAPQHRARGDVPTG